MKKFLVLCFVLGIATLNLSGSPLDLDSRWREFVSQEGSNWRPHFAGDRVRSLYGVSNRKGADNFEAASAFLDKHHSLLAIDGISDLRLVRTDQSDIGTHYTYQQYYGGFKVVGGEVAVHVDKENRVIAASSDYRRGLKGNLQYSGNMETARATAERYLGGSAIVHVGELMVYPMGSRARLVWEVQANSTKLSRGSYLLYVDANNPKLALSVRKTHTSATGKGTVFVENSVVTPTRTQQNFLNMDGSKKLAGNFCQAFNANFDKDVEGPMSDFTTATDAGRRYDFATTDPRFTEAMAFFHINKVHDRWRQFGFNKLNAKAPVFVNVAESDGGPGYDNAFYSRDSRFRTGVYVFGAGTILENLGMDADVYYHEYGHGVLDHAKPGILTALESNYGGAFHEGFGDMSAAGITGNAKVAEFGLRIKSTKRFIGRNIDNTNSFPRSVPAPGTKKSEVHHTGLIVGGAFWDLMQIIGADAAQRTVAKALNLLPSEMTFFDFRDAMLTADRNLTGGANSDEILQAFTAHGLGGNDPGQPGTAVVSALKVGAFNPNTGNVTLKTTFKRGDTIVVIANYRGTALTPGYNLIPEDADFSTPPGTSPDGFLLVDEVVNGSRSGKNGAFQGVLFTDSGTATGQYTIAIQSRLGGTNSMSPKKSIKFKIN